MNKVFVLFLFVVLCSCNRSIKRGNSATSMNENIVFPFDWLGIWSGDLKIKKGNGEEQVLPMELHLVETSDSSIYDFKIIYDVNNKKDSREYLLKEKDKTKGHYQIDEQNTILLDAFLIDNHLLQSFEVMGNSILSDIYLKDNLLHYEIIFSTKNESKISGGQLYQGDSIPAVISYPVLSTQKAILSREN